VGEVISVQLEMDSPPVLGKENDEDKSITEVPDSCATYEIIGKVIDMIATKDHDEYLIDCSVPLRVSTWPYNRTRKFCDIGDYVGALGNLSGWISFDGGSLHRPVNGKIINVRPLGTRKFGYLLTVEITDEPANRNLSWIPRENKDL